MAHLPPDFSFSASSLQDFAICKRRFYLRYVLQQAWPAPVATPLLDYERAEQLGKQFHKLIERYYMGITSPQVDPTLTVWWDNFLLYQPTDLPTDYVLPEVTTRVSWDDQRIVATFDLLAAETDGQATIVDWKTFQYRPTRHQLAVRLQTRVYPLLLTLSAPQLLGFPVPPEHIRLIYWFTKAPQQSEVFSYSAEQMMADQTSIKDYINAILTAPNDVQAWPLTDNISACRFCQYRSLCHRGAVAAPLAEDSEAVDDAQLLDMDNPTTVEDASSLDQDYVL